jgi:hypothetical protein
MRNIFDKRQELKISEISEKYPRQWVVVKVTKTDKYGWPAKGEVILQESRIDVIEDKIKDIQDNFYIFYTGSIDHKLD